MEFGGLPKIATMATLIRETGVPPHAASKMATCAWEATTAYPRTRVYWVQKTSLMVLKMLKAPIGFDELDNLAA